MSFMYGRSMVTSSVSDRVLESEFRCKANFHKHHAAAAAILFCSSVMCSNWIYSLQLCGQFIHPTTHHWCADQEEHAHNLSSCDVVCRFDRRYAIKQHACHHSDPHLAARHLSPSYRTTNASSNGRPCVSQIQISSPPQQSPQAPSRLPHNRQRRGRHRRRGSTARRRQRDKRLRMRCIRPTIAGQVGRDGQGAVCNAKVVDSAVEDLERGDGLVEGYLRYSEQGCTAINCSKRVEKEFRVLTSWPDSYTRVKEKFPNCRTSPYSTPSTVSAW